jgi:hypothetical protein
MWSLAAKALGYPDRSDTKIPSKALLAKAPPSLTNPMADSTNTNAYLPNNFRIKTTFACSNIRFKQSPLRKLHPLRFLDNHSGKQSRFGPKSNRAL